MTESDPAASGNGRRPAGSGTPTSEGSGRIATLRGATVRFDPRRLAQVALAVVIGTLAVLVVVFTVAGIHSNAQIDRLHTRGEPVTVTVRGCLGLLGGSGSNAAGYSCRGTYRLDGHSYDESLPGSTFYRPGTKIPALAVPGDPALVSPRAVIDTQHSSASVFVLPAILAGALVLLVPFVVWRYRSGRSETPEVRDDASTH